MKQKNRDKMMKKLHTDKEKRMERCYRWIRQTLIHMTIVAICSLFTVTPVFAIDAGSTLNGLNTFHTFLTQVISLVGGFFLLWGIFDFGTSLMGNDGVMQATAFKRIAAGVVCMSAGSIFTLLKG
ncbi:MAG: hypothetical protein Q4C97_08205 [Bacillota bacterium]|nr:hypothetical protein [Bacillota bacterium]